MELGSGRPFFTVSTPMKYALWLAVVFILPIVNTWLMYGGTISNEDVTLSALASLLLVNPLASAVAGGVYAWRHGFSAVLPALFAVAFVPAALVAYNDSALPYALGYLVFGFVGQGVALGIQRLRRGPAPTAS